MFACCSCHSHRCCGRHGFPSCCLFLGCGLFDAWCLFRSVVFECLPDGLLTLLLAGLSVCFVGNFACLFVVLIGSKYCADSLCFVVDFSLSFASFHLTNWCQEPAPVRHALSLRLFTWFLYGSHAVLQGRSARDLSILDPLADLWNSSLGTVTDI